MNLILLTNAFPYGSWEPYLETEIKYYGNFDRVVICALQVRDEQMEIMRSLPSSNITVCPIKKVSGIKYIANFLKCLGDSELYKEINRLFINRRVSLRRLIRLCVYVSRSHYEAREIKKHINKWDSKYLNEDWIIYSYRFEYQPYVGILLRNNFLNCKIVSRAHGYDLYEERNRDSYIPMRETLLKSIDKVYLISQDGKNYLTSKYKPYQNKMEISKLGTIRSDEYNRPQPPKINKISIVSCSNVTDLKRVGLIAKALHEINDIDIFWTHFGDGPLLPEVLEYCNNNLKNNIRFEFRGNTKNEVIHSEYRKGVYQLFLNVSTAEGIPVSIMEALSYGIPCIATDVGGTSEVITDNIEGILLKANFSVEELVSAIRRFVEMPSLEYIRFSNKAVEKWNEEYNASVNYEKFVNLITNLD